MADINSNSNSLKQLLNDIQNSLKNINQQLININEENNKNNIEIKNLNNKYDKISKKIKDFELDKNKQEIKQIWISNLIIIYANHKILTKRHFLWTKK